MSWFNAVYLKLGLHLVVKIYLYIKKELLKTVTHGVMRNTVLKH